MEGETIGKYKNCVKIAAGGMGAVYLTTHPELKRKVVIKKLTVRGRGGWKERFEREARILSELSSPYVVRMFDYFSEGKANYIVLEFVDGMSLDKLIKKQGSLPPQLALLIFLDACLGLKTAHAKDIVHRDIKPGNILISRRAAVKLADFGIAGEGKEDEPPPREASSSDATVVAGSSEAITQVGSSLGTPAYMSPEQLEDSSSVDRRSDIYSMGVMLYEMVTGKKPYPGDMTPTTILKIRKGKYTKPSKIVENLPRELKSIIKKSMKPRREKRYKTLDPVIKKVRRYLKKYDTHEIRVSLAQAVIAKTSIQFPEYEEKNKTVKKFAAIIAAVLVFCAAMVLAWRENFFQRTLLKPFFAPVSVSLTLPAQVFPDADSKAKAFFFVNDNDEIPEISRTRRSFRPKNQASESKSVEWETKDVFLKPGNYRVKVVFGPCVWWESITVDKERLCVKLDLSGASQRGLRVHFSAKDALTGEDLTQSVRFTVQIGTKWYDARKIDFSKLKTGGVYRFLLSAVGYYDEYFSLALEWYQDEIFIDGAMKKK